ncbi:MAG: tRNA pseudouridine(13) synthase TruD, partial [Phycisphaerales bacterium]|nr:tRNA pseudouridine(13) synthase TruD [Phycisphaerales bacterium]
ASPDGGPPEPPARAVWASIARKLAPSPERRAVERLARDNNALAALGELSQSDLTMSVEAFQSYLWNQTLRALVASATPAHARVEVQTDYGPCAFPIATTDDRRWTTAARELRTIELPVPAATTTLSPAWAPHLLDALKPFNLRPDQLRIEQLRRPRFNEAARPAFVRVEDLAFGPPANDELAPKRSTKPLKRTVSFSLPRGAYATVLMRALGCE